MYKNTLLLSVCLTFGLTMNAQNTFPTTGNVGIGTSSPTNSLHIIKGSQNGDIKLDGGRLIAGNISDVLVNGEYRAKILTDGAMRMNSSFPYFYMNTNVSDLETKNVELMIAPAIGDTYFSNVSKKGDFVFKMSARGNNGGSMIFDNENKHGNNHFKFTTTAYNETSASTKLIISNNGNVGIGTETPDAKLAVNGDIHSKEVRIDLNNRPDYVFNENHKLPTLIEAEQHIKEKGYLINMPSATTIEAKGLELGEITRLQQEKIEKLTLYIIALNKRIERLEQQNNQKQ